MSRQWSEVNRRARGLDPYPGVSELIQDLHDWNQKIAIVTTSPSMVAEGFVKRHEWPVDTVVGYHHVSHVKPHPQGLVIALARCGTEASMSFHVGDKAEDTEASHNAGVFALGAGWGTEDIDLLRDSGPVRVFISVEELHAYLRSVLGAEDTTSI